jgi:ATP-binding cassette, subfamily B, bacterial
MALPPADDSRSNREGWELIRATLRDQRRGIALGVLVGLAWTVGKVTAPLLVQTAIDRGIVTDDSTALWRWSLAVAGAGLVAASFTGLRRWFAFRESRWAETKLRDRLFAHLQRLHFAFHDEAQTGELMSRANTDLQQIQHFIVLIPLTISNAATVAAVTVILALTNPVLTVLALGALPFLNWLGKRFATRLHIPAMAIQRESAELATVVEETVSGIRVVKGFGAEGGQAARLSAEADDVYRESMNAARVRASYLPAMELLPNIGLIAVLGYGGHQVLDGALTLGEFVAFNVYVVLLIWPLRMLGMIIAQSQRSAASAQRVHEILATDPVIVDHDGSRSLPPRRPDAPGGAVRFEHVGFGYGGAMPVLSGFDLEIAAGESVALVGATGSGKSTVAHLLPRFYDVDEGVVRLDGVDVADLHLVELRRAVGIVFEETFLFHDTVAANIAFADASADQRDIERAARLAGADEFIAALPEGWATIVGERGFSLSGGQRQRLAIARAILADPRVLILDDATSAVDPTKEHEIRDALTEVMHGRSTVVIAHRPATIALADRVVLIEDGRVSAEGTHHELLATDPRYRRVLAAAAHDEEERSAESDEAAAVHVGGGS